MHDILLIAFTNLLSVNHFITISPFLSSSPIYIYFLFIQFLGFLKVNRNLRQPVFMPNKRAQCIPFCTLPIVYSVHSSKFLWCVSWWLGVFICTVWSWHLIKDSFYSCIEFFETFGLHCISVYKAFVAGGSCCLCGREVQISPSQASFKHSKVLSVYLITVMWVEEKMASKSCPVF